MWKERARRVRRKRGESAERVHKRDESLAVQTFVGLAGEKMRKEESMKHRAAV